MFSNKMNNLILKQEAFDKFIEEHFGLNAEKGLNQAL